MPRKPHHESGVAKSVTLRLSPDPLDKLDRLSVKRELTRSAIVARILDREIE